MRADSDGQPDSTYPVPLDWRKAESELLNRAKEVAQQIVERVRRVTGDTETHSALPTHPAEEAPPAQ